MSTGPHQSANALGIDVAHYEGTVDWRTVLRSGMSFAFAKATDGVGFTDPQFTANWNLMGQVGITRGAYHFFRPSKDPAAQAEHFLGTVPFIATDMPAVLDVETVDGMGRDSIVRGVKTWLTAVEKATKVAPIIYTSPAFAAEHLSDEFGQYPLWIAHYTFAAQPIVPDGWSDWTLWQYASGESGRVHVPGVSGAVDADRFNGTHADLISRFQL